ncbi:hypothetical protein BDV33DRAFT_168439 [Aspergillus novoparasiticus]|uniref:Jacalin-type lectin domain-containing protein n=1 Tax=Aspergillus novoparasiticus TaxID=986946 RepID=A0A5N6F199_9EURO|nr:hypothetical protein BDV33DRAFT_168439 [Aspergillus novoparasiticus]
MGTRNDHIGGTGGDDFGDRLYHNGDPVTKVEFWYGPGGDYDHEILRAIRVHWGSDHDEAGATQEKRKGLLHTTHDLDKGKVQSLQIYGTFNLDHPKSGDTPDEKGRVDSVRLLGLDAFAAGGHWGYDNGGNGEQDLGNGVLLGFWGKAGDDIDSLGSIFN